jgi:hypothetical protein
MSTNTITQNECEVVKQIEAEAREARRKAAIDWESPNAMIYSAVSLALRSAVHRHLMAPCTLCQSASLAVTQ